MRKIKLTWHYNCQNPRGPHEPEFSTEVLKGEALRIATRKAKELKTIVYGDWDKPELRWLVTSNGELQNHFKKEPAATNKQVLDTFFSQF